ncbi:FGGY-family carbohydrate kinase [Actinocrinis puniceicyclus]|uniref:FGGY-family carbohydrate kinase n=1 Tax=Actinocrinis puniceicyclus TaxID=977794 RepID=A0A8J8BFM0_9ACTN|nr:FGGY-family carbohydrate kinase [Actinocrinis puniceicyclus]MBS2966306.1 FGGY-family carbohydrate kinase [Actinocrinis puniceicyclus]
MNAPQQRRANRPAAAGARYVLGVDLGTSGPKVALADTRGRLLGHAKARVPLRLLPGAGAEQDPHAWWDAICAAAKAALAQAAAHLGHDPAPGVAAVCFSAQWGGTVPVAADGAPTHPAVIWMDARGAGYSRAVAGGAPTVPGTGYNAWKLRAWLAKTGGAPSLTGKDPVGQALFLKHERPEAYAAAAYLLDVPEYLTMRATGRAVAAHDTAVLRWCTDNRTPGAVRWDPALVRRCGLDPAKLPELTAPGALVGPLTARAAADLGLTTAALVVAGTGDTTAAAIGAGAVRDHDAHLYVGTSAWLSCHVPYKKTDLRTSIASLPAAVPGRYWVATVQDVAGKAVDWLIENVLHEQRPASAHEHLGALERLNALAAASPPGARGVLFTPWLNGERTPVDDSSLRGGWFNASLSTDRADLARSVFEGIAHNTRWMLAAVERFTGRHTPGGLGALRFIGGGATSPLWCQAMADILDHEIRQVAEPVLANVRGAALLALVALGELTWDQIPDLVRIERVYRPDPANRAAYERAHEAFLQVYRRNRRLYARLNPAPHA